MREIDVRRLLYKTAIKQLVKTHPATRVVNEMVLLQGAVRVDVAAINDSLHGYEIKSPSDNLARLPMQQNGYGKVFDKMTLVAAESHVEHAVKLLPKCWGLITVGLRGGEPHANEIWPAISNYNQDSLALAQLLWRDEALELLEYFGLTSGMSRRPRKVLWRTLANNLTLQELKAFVCYKLRVRKNWRGH